MIIHTNYIHSLRNFGALKLFLIYTIQYAQKNSSGIPYHLKSTWWNTPSTPSAMPERFSNISSRQFVNGQMNHLWSTYRLVNLSRAPWDLVPSRLKLTLQYIVKLQANIDNPAFDCVLIHNMKIYTTKIRKVFNQLDLHTEKWCTFY